MITWRSPRLTAGFRILTGDLIFGPILPTRYMVDRFIRRGTVTLLAAYAGSGKTWILIDLLAAVATGAKWLGKFQCEKARALYIDWENGVHEVRRRIQGVTKARLGKGHRISRLGVCFEPGNVDTDEFEDRLSRLAEEWDLIVIDPLKAAAPGVSENDSEVRGVLDRLRRVARSTNCAIVVAHHVGKNSKNVDPREMPRGNSAIMDAVDAAFVVRLLKDQAMKIVNAKSRNGPVVPPIFARIDDVGLGGVSVHVVDEVAEDTNQVANDVELKKNVLTFVRENPGTSGKSIEGAVTGKADRIRRAVKDLLVADELEDLGKTGRPKYRVPRVQRRAMRALGNSKKKEDD
jgi:hypothetical protein